MGNTNFPSQLKASKRWPGFEKWYKKFGLQIIIEYTVNPPVTDTEYPIQIKEFAQLPFAFQQGVLLQFLREEWGIHIEVPKAGGMYFCITYLAQSNTIGKSIADPDTALQMAILEAFNL